MSKKKTLKDKSSLTLTPQQNLFCHEYLKDRNATQAAIRAKYSAKMAYSIGPRLLTRPNVAYKINRLIEEQLDRLEVKADLVIKEIVKLGYFDIQDIYNEDGSIKAVKDMPEVVRKAISSVEVDEIFLGKGVNRKVIGYTTKIKFWSKEKALEILAKYLKLIGNDAPILPGAKIIFQDIVINGKEAPELLGDINNRLLNQFSKS